MVSRDLACGYLRLMQQIEGGDQPMSLWKILQYRKPGCEWGRHIRSSPQSDPELLQKLNQFLPPQEVFLQREFPLAPVEFHDVIQWLKTSPNPQPNLIDRWQGYLAESIVQDRKNSFNQKDYSDDTLEKRWQDHLKRETDFHRPPQEEVIQCWETVLRKAREEDKDDGGEDSSGSEQQRWQ
ncbi:hypothetical protein B0H14DRAFT_2755409 [Mycena olivaceomarginata]|nr:hypothetical protein B0H14DRAFT_2755409 [Mycena olivaceomarginata]